MKKIVISLVCLLATVAVTAKDIKTIVVTTNPVMHCENCENTIKNNLRFEKGIKKIETNVEEQRVTITYDADKNTAENILKAFNKFGYTATDVNAAPAEKKGCNGNCAGCQKQAEGGCCKAEAKAEGSHCGQCADGAKAEGKGCCKDKAEGQKTCCGQQAQADKK